MKIKDRFERLSSRDQKTLKIGTLALGILIALQFIWWPLFHAVTTLQQDIAQEQSLIEWMMPRVAQLIETQHSGKSVKNEKSLSAIEKSLQQAGLKSYVTAFSQNAQRQISVTFADVPFESCMEWIEEAQSQGWVVQQFNANKSDKTGVVKVDLILG